MGIVRDLYYARKMSAGLKLPAPTVALLIKRLRLAAAMGGGIEKTVSGTMVHITDALAKAALSVLASIEPIQDLHGYSSPWPAGGGANKYNADTKMVGKMLLTASGGVYNNQNWECSDFIPATAGDITLSWESDTNFFQANVCAYDANKGFINESGVSFSGYGYSHTFTVPIGTAYVRFSWTKVISGTEHPRTNVRVNIGPADLSFSPYSNICPISGRTGVSVYVSPTQDVADATTYAIDWTSEAGTVYGGTLDVVTGVLTVDRAMVDLGTLTWGFSTTTAGNVKSYYSDGISTLIKPVASHNDTPDMISSKYQTFSWNSRISVTNGISMLGNGQLRIIDINYQSKSALSDFTASLFGVQLCYELATPLTYQLTGQEVEMLLGENYVWSSSGDTVSVTYYAEGNANPLQSLNILLGGNYSNPKTADDVSDKEALEIILGGNK